MDVQYIFYLFAGENLYWETNVLSERVIVKKIPCKIIMSDKQPSKYGETG